MRRRILRFFSVTLVIFLVAALGLGIYCYRLFSGSLAKLEGTVFLPGLKESVEVERDAAGVPTIMANNVEDRAEALGFLHAQDRFFQMDLMRRVAAGELSELVGSAALDVDKTNRLHQFRARAREVIDASDAADQATLDRYAAGVNAGLRELSSKPIEYHILGVEPRTWVPEDTVLCLYAMYLDLQGRDYKHELGRHTAYATLPKPLADFLCPKGTMAWDSPIEGGPIEENPMPGPEVIDLRAKPAGWDFVPDPTTAEMFGSVDYGSNNWAVAGAHTKHGGAIVADDMHLGLRVPNTWYRVSIVVPAEESGIEGPMRATGVSLPGAPSLVVGSNEHIAWGFTNTEGDWLDTVIIESDPDDPTKYLTPDGPKSFEIVEEKIAVKGMPDEIRTIEKTEWGPIIATDSQGRKMALRWVAHDVEGVNLKSAHMIRMRTLDDAIAFAGTCGNPAQNFTVVDRSGRIGWTVMGRVPKRTYDGWLPVSYADGTNRWEGYLNPADNPKVVDPPQGRIWTANARVAGGENLAKMGFGSYDLGARQKQIRDRLLEIEQADEKEMLALQLDDRALFWNRWQELLVGLLDDSAVADAPLRKEGREYIANWGGKASIDSVGYRLVRLVHLEITRRMLEWLTSPCRAADPTFRTLHLPRGVEAVIWKLASEKPMHLLDPQYESWNEALLACVDAALETATAEGRPMSAFTWGAHNTLDIQHPLSGSLRDVLGPSLVDQIGLDMPHVPISGGSRHMPKIARPRSGASERMAVSPGKESEGIFHMPTGQSGHPFSPFYRAGHEDWVQGRPSPFLPGPAQYRLRMELRQD